ncbi:MAG: site-specific DNA-methyltransferase [Gammaproteobacteria bacterium]|nr:site-specific DNA-methyltransferase [Gammaproteobacteria bacterium]
MNNPAAKQLGTLVVAEKNPNGFHKGERYRFYNKSSFKMGQCADESIALTITSPPYWNAVDYDIHATNGKDWYRNREYTEFGKTYSGWLANIKKVFKEVYRVTIDGGFCAVVIGTILHKGKHYPAPYDLSRILQDCNFEFHQDIIWNKVTGGIKRAGVFIQHPQAGYYYPNIMTEYILVFRKGKVSRRDKRKAMPIDDVFKRDIANNIWHIAPVPPNTIDHPCPYPSELVRRLVLLYSQKDDEILDPFLGSGQTALAALEHGRRIVGYDIEKSYIDLTLKRITTPLRRRKYNLIARFDKVAAG